MDECKRMGMQVLGPDVNESNLAFTVNKQGNIRFGMGAIKGIGEAAIISLIEERKNRGPFNTVFEMVERCSSSAMTKKNVESLALSGALDSFGLNRSQYFETEGKEFTFIENLIRYGSKYQADKDSMNNTLFGGPTTSIEIVKPEIPRAEEWGGLEKLNKEKELVGIYLSAHPLDDYRLEIDHFCNVTLSQLNDLRDLNGKDLTFAGIVTSVRQGTSKNGKPYGIITIEDYTDSYKLMFFSNDWVDNSKYFQMGYSLLFKGRVQSRMYNEAELEVKVKSIMMLPNVRDEMVKSISLVVPLQMVTDQLMLEIMQHSDAKGKIQLKFKIIDTKDNLVVDLFSRNTKVNITESFINYLKSSEGIEFRLN
jgi:DNA polymerase-3 subunit alpha